MPETNILIIDDDQALVAALKEGLESLGYRVSAAYDGLQGILQAHQGRPRVIMLDFNMPAGGGAGVYERLRGSSDTAKIPIIFMTAATVDEVKGQIRSTPNTYFLKKPVSVAQLRKVLDKVLGDTSSRKKTAAGAPPTTESVPAAPPPTREAPPAPDSAPFAGAGPGAPPPTSPAPFAPPPTGGAPAAPPPTGSAPFAPPPTGGAPAVPPPTGGSPAVPPPTGAAPFAPPPAGGPPGAPPPDAAPAVPPPTGPSPFAPPPPGGPSAVPPPDAAPGGPPPTGASPFAPPPAGGPPAADPVPPSPGGDPMPPAPAGGGEAPDPLPPSPATPAPSAAPPVQDPPAAAAPPEPGPAAPEAAPAEAKPAEEKAPAPQVAPFAGTSPQPPVKCHEFEVRVTYADTDRLGIIYYANYFKYFELGRTELLRSLGLRYRDMEMERKVFLPVVETRCVYLGPSRYDDLLLVRTWLSWMGPASLCFQNEIYDREATDRLVARGFSRHAVLNEYWKPVRLPKDIRELLAVYLTQDPGRGSRR